MYYLQSGSMHHGLFFMSKKKRSNLDLHEETDATRMFCLLYIKSIVNSQLA